MRGGYLGEDGPSCGGQPSVPFNAFYCPSQDFLAWDENLMAAGYQQIGDAWVYLIIAHEWGHAIQARLQADQVSVAAELQADCFAGATLFGAADRGLLQFERGRHPGAAGDAGRGRRRLPVDQGERPRRRPAADQRVQPGRSGRRRGPASPEPA